MLPLHFMLGRCHSRHWIYPLFVQSINLDWLLHLKGRTENLDVWVYVRTCPLMIDACDAILIDLREMQHTLT